MKDCGFSIRQIRRNKDLTQEYMAFELGISQKAYSDLENCKVKMNMTTLLKVADILEISPNEICSLSDNCLSDADKKFSALVDYLKEKKIDVPEDLL